MNEQPNHFSSEVEPDFEYPVTPKFGIERWAWVKGIVAAIVWFSLVEMMFSVLEGVVSNHSYWSFLGHYKLGWIAAVVLALAHGTFVGYVTAWTARRHTYVSAIAVVLFANIGCLQNIWLHLASAMVPLNSRTFWIFIFIALPTISLLGALNGIYLAQSAKRRHFVRIQ